MQLRRLTEIAALAAFHSRQLVQRREPVADELLQQYLAAARDLSARWRDTLRQFEPGGPAAEKSTPRLSGLLSEVMVTEVLVRVWTAVLVEMDRQRWRPSAERLARHVLLSVLEVRYRTLRTALEREAALGALSRLDRLRRLCERWGDLLIGHVGDGEEVLEFAFDRDRAREQSITRSARPADAEAAHWTFLAAGLETAFPADEIDADRRGPQRRLLQAILRALPSRRFETPGTFWPPCLPRFSLSTPLSPEPEAGTRLSAVGRRCLAHLPRTAWDGMGINFRQLYRGRDDGTA